MSDEEQEFPSSAGGSDNELAENSHLTRVDEAEQEQEPAEPAEAPEEEKPQKEKEDDKKSESSQSSGSSSSSSSSEEEPEAEPEPEPEREPEPKRRKKKVTSMSRRREEEVNREEEVQDDTPRQTEEERRGIETFLKDVMSHQVKYEKSQEDWDEKAKTFLNKMEKAVRSDLEDFAARRRPFARIRFMKEMKNAVLHKKMSKALMRAKFLNSCAQFITPYVDDDGSKTFPSPGLVKDLVDVLSKLNVAREDLEDTSIIKQLESVPMKKGTDIHMARQHLLSRWRRTVVVAQEEDEVDTESKMKTRFHPEELDDLARDAHAERQQYDLDELKIEQAIKAKRKAPGVKRQQEYQEKTRFVVPISTHPRKKIPHGSTQSGGPSSIHRLLQS